MWGGNRTVTITRKGNKRKPNVRLKQILSHRNCDWIELSLWNLLQFHATLDLCLYMCEIENRTFTISQKKWNKEKQISKLHKCRCVATVIEWNCHFQSPEISHNFRPCTYKRVILKIVQMPRKENSAKNQISGSSEFWRAATLWPSQTDTWKWD